VKRAIIVSVAVVVAAFSMPSCSPSTPPDEVFETVWTTFDGRYAIFGPKSIDWQALGDEYRPRVTAATTDEELFTVLTEMLSHLNDNHVILKAPSLGRDFSAGYLGKYFEEMGFEGAMEYLKTRPLPERYFVDVRHNSGGDDRVGKAIADRFADRKRLYMVTRDRNGPKHDDFAEPKYWHVDPAERTFTGPVILLTSRLSISAAENFALAMRVIPHVTVVGDTTSGCFADMEWHDLPNGWTVSVSRNLFVDYTGKCWEGTGVPPDVIVRGEHRDGDADRALETALSLLEGGGPPLQDESASAEAVMINLVDFLSSGLDAGDFAHARASYERARRELPPEKCYFHRVDINALGYKMLTAERLDDAVAVFELYVELLSWDFNAYDSLGEAYMIRGDTEKAIANYERSLELNPDNEGAVKMLEKLRG